jgi:alpha-mannosidase
MEIFKKIALTLLSAVFSAALCFGQDNSGNSQKTQEMDVVGHAHMDMGWLWQYNENIKMANDNLRQIVRFMEEYPDYKAVLSQPAVFQFVEKNDPELFKKITKYVKEGRLEPVGGTWVESDNNLPSGEALSRSFLLGQTYYMNHFGRRAVVGWFGDDFGHTSQLPQILRLSGLKYYYFHRCVPGPGMGSFTWEGSDGSKVLAFKSETYNGDPSADNIIRYLRDFPAGGGKTFLPIGAGDHGGGPSRENIENVHRLDADPSFPAKVKFTTAEEFYKSIEPYMADRPTHKGEMQFVFEGCYTNVAEIKEFNRRCENTLYEAELMNTVNWLTGGNYSYDVLHDAWTNVAFNQFHDILPGSAIYESNRESVSRYEEAWRKTRENRDVTFYNLADKIKYRTDYGQPVVAVNMQPYERKAIVEVSVFSYDQPASTGLSIWPDFYGGKNVSAKDGNNMSVLVRDNEGNTYPAQVIAGKMFPPGWRSTVQFVVDKMPAGYKTFYVDVSKPAVNSDPIPVKDGKFTTDYYEVGFDLGTGDINSLIDRKSGKQYVAAGKKFNTLRIYMETKYGGMKSWMINHANYVSDVETVPGSVKITNGPVRACIESDKVWGNSKFHVRTYVYKTYPRVDFDVDVDWLEWGNETKDSPMLRAVFPVNMDSDARLYCHVPFDVVERPANGKFKGGEIPISEANNESIGSVPTTETSFGQEVPAHFFSDVNNGKEGIAIINNSKYGYSYDAGEFRLSLMRSAGNPDFYPNLGRFNIRYSIYPHEGDWAQANVMLEGEAFNNPVYASEPRSTAMEAGSKNAPQEASLFKVDATNVQVTAIKKAESGNELIVRFAEMEGKDTNVTITLPVQVKKARRLNLLEENLPEAAKATVSGKTVTVEAKPHEVVTLGLQVGRLNY